MASIAFQADLLHNWDMVSEMSHRVLRPMKSLLDYGKLKSKYGARHCLSCTDISHQSHFPAPSPGFAHRRFGKTGASTMPLVITIIIIVQP